VPAGGEVKWSERLLGLRRKNRRGVQNSNSSKREERIKSRERAQSDEGSKASTEKAVANGPVKDEKKKNEKSFFGVRKRKK